MKKIVALVLSLVMALSLCTVAFGIDYIKGENMYLVESDGTVNYEHYVAVTKTTAAVKNTDGTGSIEYYTGNDGKFYVACEKADAERAFYTDNSFETYVRSIPEGYWKYDGIGTAQSKNDGPATCTVSHFKVDGYIWDGNFWLSVKNTADAQKALLVGDEIVYVKAAADSDVVWASHVLLKGVKNDKTGYYEAKCAICGGTYAYTDSINVLKANSIKESDTFYYRTDDAKKVIDENKAAGKYSLPVGTDLANSNAWAWEIAAGSTTTDTNKDGVTSAKTFDAGVAMYVGMSLLSVAGGAVVIGKKKEF